MKTKTFLPGTGVPANLTVAAVLRDILTHPVETLVRRWNWKAAFTSVIMRGGIFFTVNLSAGLDAALAVLLTEFVFRTVTSGSYGAVLQAFSRVEPAWAAALTTILLLPAANHIAEFFVHWLRGTPKLATSIIASVCFTVLSTLFNLYIMRKGALLVGEQSNTLWHDMKQMPRLLAGFVALGPIAVYRAILRPRR